MNFFRKQVLSQVILSKPYIFYFWITFLVYELLNIWLNEVHISFLTFIHSTWWIVLPYLFFTLLTGLLVALNVNLVIYKIKEAQLMTGKSATGTSALGAFIGLLAGACPSCFVGLFPAFMGLFGVTLSLGALPLFGVEIHILSSLLLLLGAYLLTKEVSCYISERKKK